MLSKENFRSRDIDCSPQSNVRIFRYPCEKKIAVQDTQLQCPLPLQHAVPVRCTAKRQTQDFQRLMTGGLVCDSLCTHTKLAPGVKHGSGTCPPLTLPAKTRMSFRRRLDTRDALPLRTGSCDVTNNLNSTGTLRRFFVSIIAVKSTRWRLTPRLQARPLRTGPSQSGSTFMGPPQTRARAGLEKSGSLAL